MSLAALPLYDWPEIRAETDAFWGALARGLDRMGFAPPASLERTRPAEELWADPDLLFAQTCGLPYVAGAARATRIVAAPVHEIEGCGAGTYASALVARRGEASGPGALHGARFAANGPDSLSGWAALLDLMGPDALGEVAWTGAHRASIVAVAEGRADAAAVDAVVWALARRFEPAAAALEVVAWSDPAPAPPFVTSALVESGDRARLRRALVNALHEPETAPMREALGLVRIVAFADTDYDAARRLAALARRTATILRSSPAAP